MPETADPIPFTAAGDFVAALRRSSPYWLQSDQWESPWIFRGEADDLWDLVPSAWREKTREHLIFRNVDSGQDVDDAAHKLSNSMKAEGGKPQFAFEHCRQFIVQNRSEYNVVDAFLRLLDDLGFAIPGGVRENHRPRCKRLPTCTGRLRTCWAVSW